MSLYEKTIHELHGMLIKKEISAEELTKDVLARMDQVEDKVKSFVFREEKEKAIAQAKGVDEKISRGEKVGPLAGIPMAYNDNICTKGIRTTCSSKMLADFVPPYDAFVAEKIGEAQSVFIGKTNMDEFGIGSSTESSFFYPTRNPWNLNLVPGGSGGGAAAAVAADEAVFALGSDILNPAAFCGVVAMKPTYGRVSRYGLAGSTSSLEQVGPVTKDVTDCALVLGAIAGHDPKDSTSAPGDVPRYDEFLTGDIKGMHIGIPKEYFGNEFDPEVKDAVLSAVKKMEELGAHVDEVSLPHTPYVMSAYHVIAAAEASSVLARYEGVRYGYRREDVPDIEALYRTTRTEGFGPAVKRRIILGTYFLSSGQIDVYYKKALQTRTLVKEDFDRAFEKYDLLVSPTCPGTAFPLGTQADDILNGTGLYTVPPCVAGIPAISLPCGLVQGLPVGLQIMGPAFAEEKILNAAFAYQQRGGFPRIKPSLSGEGK
ncbi:MAG: Asp-tRNA(Asn)/Glu-tRNA(Gln) amidotransferase subunit GatA [Bacillota bacterium]|nr:Asp-tRNA(Asn)/Glu-tRNA(Gln) amidotransferase subunit GatA [Clostridia bacterium]